MKRPLLALLCFVSAHVFAAGALSDSSSPDGSALSANGAMPADYPSYIYVRKVPLGSGTPAVGVTVGYDKAIAVSDGLYHVPGYLPYSPSAGPVEARVVRVHCLRVTAGWFCDGYTLDASVSRGENILLQPYFN